MTDKERILRLEFLIKLLAIYTDCHRAVVPSNIVIEIIDEYCAMHDIPNPLN